MSLGSHAVLVGHPHESIVVVADVSDARVNVSLECRGKPGVLVHQLLGADLAEQKVQRLWVKIVAAPSQNRIDEHAVATINPDEQSLVCLQGLPSPILVNVRPENRLQLTPAGIAGHVLVTLRSGGVTNDAMGHQLEDAE